VLPSAPTAPAAEWGRFHISRDHTSRYFVLYDQRGLVTVTVEKTGTQAVQERLEADARTIGDLQRQVAKLTARFHAQAPPSTGPAYAAAILRRALAPPAAVETASATPAHCRGPHRLPHHLIQEARTALEAEQKGHIPAD
jgi:hypothetical protein